MLSGDVRHRIRGVITDVTGSDISICEEIGENVRIEQQCTTDTDVFAVGQLYTGTVELTLLGADELQRETLRGGTVTLEFGLEGHDEWVPLGIWNITDPQRGSENSIMIKGVDNTSKLDVEIPVFVGHVKMTDRIRMIKKLTGLDEPVIRFLEDDGEILTFLDSVYKLADHHVARYIQRGFTSLMFSFGCTGGQHRSVYCAQHLAEHIHRKYGVEVRICHREQEITQVLESKN